jgi:dipeptidyl aminopeptidase/acylaminoacyl peptidase
MKTINAWVLSSGKFRVLGAVAAMTLASVAGADVSDDVLSEIPVVPAVAAKRAFTVEDLVHLRDIDTLSVSPNGAHFAVLVRQAVPEKNSYRMGWFTGSAAKPGPLVFAGGGGEAAPTVAPTGNVIGQFSVNPDSRWSPDEMWIAYPVTRGGDTQLWRSRRDGSVREQLTRNPADVRDFAWSADGLQVYFTAGTPRAQLRERYEAQSRRGYRFHDFGWASQVITPGHPPRSLEANPAVWVVNVSTRAERKATDEETREFERLRREPSDAARGGVAAPQVKTGAGTSPIRSSRDSWAWLAPDISASPSAYSPVLRVTASLVRDGSNPIVCGAPECAGIMLRSLWWSADGKRVIFWNMDRRNGFDPVLYSWAPSTGRVSTLVPGSGDRFRSCVMRQDQLICLRESHTEPRHVAAIDTRSGKIATLANVNPELGNVRFGKVERIDWEVPPSLPELGYPSRAAGSILYPPDFDPTRKYPVFIAPYQEGGFHRGDAGDEHPLFAYVANGIIVLHTSFPHPTGGLGRMSVTEYMKLLYSSEHDFPHLTTLMKSTLAALDLVSRRGFVDEKRVGIGGVSHGTFVPLYMLQKEDRLAAVSIAGGHWNEMQYYGSTPSGSPRDQEWAPAPFGETAGWFNRIDIAQHVGEIEAPILFNFPDAELFVSVVLMRHMENERKPFDAYVFPNEYHIKWQSAHREAVYRRNLDWFRFWLQDYEDAAPEKQEQYERWRELRKLQCENGRSVRDYCAGGGGSR